MLQLIKKNYESMDKPTISDNKRQCFCMKLKTNALSIKKKHGKVNNLG